MPIIGGGIIGGTVAGMLGMLAARQMQAYHQGEVAASSSST